MDPFKNYQKYSNNNNPAFLKFSQEALSPALKAQASPHFDDLSGEDILNNYLNDKPNENSSVPNDGSGELFKLGGHVNYGIDPKMQLFSTAFPNQTMDMPSPNLIP